MDFIDVSMAQMLQQNLLCVCQEAKKGASRGYLEIRLRAVLNGTRLHNAVKHLNSVADDKFLGFVYNLYLMSAGLRAPKF